MAGQTGRYIAGETAGDLAGVIEEAIVAGDMGGETRGDMTGWYMELEMRKYMAEWTGTMANMAQSHGPPGSV